MQAKIHRGTQENLQFLARRLRAGELVAVPSETVYGLAADALSAKACRAIFTAKGRPANDPLIVHVSSIAQAASVALLNDPARRLMRRFWPGPLTIVLPKKPVVPDIVTSGQPSVAVRMPAHPLFLKLLALTGTPLAAPSANPFGYVSPTTAAHVQDGLRRRIKHILDGGPCEVGVESTIVDLRDPRRPRLLRPGKITQKDLERVLKTKVKSALARTKPAPAGMLAPGMLTRHYSPRTPVIAHRKLSLKTALAPGAAQRAAWVFLHRPIAAGAAKNVFGWSAPSLARSASAAPTSRAAAARPAAQRLRGARFTGGDSSLAPIARNLFALLRTLDAQGWDQIHVELAPLAGLGAAINDRLRRAAAG